MASSSESPCLSQLALLDDLREVPTVERVDPCSALQGGNQAESINFKQDETWNLSLSLVAQILHLMSMDFLASTMGLWAFQVQILNVDKQETLLWALGHWLDSKRTLPWTPSWYLDLCEKLLGSRPSDGWHQTELSLSTLQDQLNLNGLLEATLDDLLLIILWAGWSIRCFMQNDKSVGFLCCLTMLDLLQEADGWLQAGISLSTLQDQGNLNSLLEATLDDLLLIILLAGWNAWHQAGVSLSTLQDKWNLNSLLEATQDDLLLIIRRAGWNLLCFMHNDKSEGSLCC
ncbi:hypothetical protein H920_17186 [Fukomys damarensis]|uniref:Uncharacterized protein n=1 Tax=Fukomys damarensis TaxID=885580 RepID=A0A091CST0_FUKDA|nr:hypothetical protein H920_17186 [Fukomys damarensis]